MKTVKQQKAHRAFEERVGHTLLRCPCCGGIAFLTQWRDTKVPNATWVICQNDNCALTTRSCYSKYPEKAAAQAVAVWNRRATV